MKEIELEEIAGIWRHEEEGLTVDLYIRTEGSSRYTEILPDNTIRVNQEGNGSIEEDDDVLKLSINDDFSVTVWHCKPEEEDLIIEVDGTRYQMEKISG